MQGSVPSRSDVRSNDLGDYRFPASSGEVKLGLADDRLETLGHVHPNRIDAAWTAIDLIHLVEHSRSSAYETGTFKPKQPL